VSTDASSSPVPIEMAPRLNRQSLGNQIATRLRQEILLGRLPPGRPVSQQQLCEQYGTSRMPVRDALVKLTNEGLIEGTPGGHSVVARITAEDILDAFDIEAVVHGRAGRRAVARATDDEIATLKALHGEMLSAARAKDFDRLTDLNWSFHKNINVMARSAKLLAVIRSTSLDIPRAYLSALPGSVTKVNREHAAIVKSFVDRDADRVEALIHRHVADAGADLATYLSDQGLFGPT
jgi:DNA-binding GntR family transcriptional regulator